VFTHLGSFRVPTIVGDDANGFAYGGGALAYHAANHSLFMAGHRTSNKLGEISVPTLGGTAALLQAPVDPTAGKLGQIGADSKVIGGTLVRGDQVIVSAYVFYDAEGKQILSHFVRPRSLTAASPISGPLRVGPMGAGFYSGYMGDIPVAWQARLGGTALTGNADLSIVSRTSLGPCAAAFDPLHIDGAAALLVGYPMDHATLGAWNQSNPRYGGADTVTGVAFPPQADTVIFFGCKGTTFCYGEGSPDNPPPTGQCYDPTQSSKGQHGYPYQPYAWLYDAADLAAVKSGAKWPWDVVPYATVVLPLMGAQVGGVAYDPTTNQLYISELYAAAWGMPIIHVFTVA
jgi:hypothetical protein